MANVFDQFDPAPQASVAPTLKLPSASTGNVFDQFDSPAPGAQVTPVPTLQNPNANTGDFMRGLKTAAHQLPQLTGGAVAFGGDVLSRAGKALGGDGSAGDAVTNYGLDVYKRHENDTQQLSKPSDSFTHVLKNPSELGHYLKYNAGYMGGQLLESAAVMGAGALAGSEAPGVGNAAGAVAGLVARPVVERMVLKKAAELVAEKGLAKEAAEAAARTAVNKTLGREAGAGISGFALNTGQELGSIYADARDQAKTDGRTLTGGDLARVGGSALAAGAVDTLADRLNLGDALKGVKVADGAGKSMLRRRLEAAGKVAGIDAARGAGTELAQTVAERYGAGQSMTDQAAVQDYVDSSAAGAVGGAMTGAGAGLHVQKPAAAAQPVADVPNPGAAPGSLSDAANVLHQPATGPVGRAAQEAVRSGATEAAQAAQSANPVSTNPSEPANPSARAEAATPGPAPAPGIPPWADPATGELGTPTKGQLTQALADHILVTYLQAGHMRINTQDVADAWGVPKKAVNGVRNRAQKMASDQVAAAEREAMNPAAPRSFDDIATDINQTHDAAANRLDQAVANAPGATDATNERVPEPAPAEAAGLGAEAASQADEQPAASVDNGAAAPAAELVANSPAAVAGERAAADTSATLTTPTENTDGTAQPGVVPQGDIATGGNSGPSSTGSSNEQGGAGSEGRQAPSVAAEAPAQETAAPRATGAEAAAAQPSPAAVTPPAQKAPRTFAASGGATGGGSAPVSHVHAALQKIAGFDHPEQVLGMVDEPTVRSVAKALGHRFSDKAPINTIIAKIGAEPVPDTQKKASSALVKMGVERSPALQSRAKTFQSSPAARKAETLRVKTPDGEVNGRTHIDQLVKRGFNQLTSTRAGDKMVHGLSNAAGERERIHARQLAYAQEVTAKAASPTAAPAVNDSLTTRKAEPTTEDSSPVAPSQPEGNADRRASTEQHAAGPRSADEASTAAAAEHLESGAIPEPATPAEIQKSAAKAADTIGMAEARKVLLQLIDEAAGKAPSEDADGAITLDPPRTENRKKVWRIGMDRTLPNGLDVPPLKIQEGSKAFLVYHGRDLLATESSLAGAKFAAERMLRAADWKAEGKSNGRWDFSGAVPPDYVTLDVPGDGKFKVINTRERLQAFRKEVEAKFKAPRGPVVPNDGTGESRSTRMNDATREKILSEAEQVDEAAHEAATSPQNDLPAPTEGQIEAGNYKKGHIDVQGLDISIENPRGSTRSGKREDGTTWEHVMSDHYGYVRGTVGADGEHVDVYVGPHPESSRVFVVDQIDQKTGKFDEHKAMIGFAKQGDAIAAYKSNFDKGWKMGRVTGMSMDEFKAWLKDGDTKAPLKPVTAPPPTPLKNFGWDAVKLSEHSYDELNTLRAQVEQQHANPKDAEGHPLANGKPTINIYDREGRRKLDALAWAVTYKLQESRAERERVAAEIAKGNPPPAVPERVQPEPMPTSLPAPVSAPAKPVQMTMEEWKAIHKDFKGTTAGQRTVLRDGRLVPVEIVKQATTGPDAASASSSAAPIEDFGERLEGARKFLPPSLKEELGDEQIATQPLSKFWPADAHESIEDPGTAAVAFTARAEVPAKPRVAYKVKRWVEKVKFLRDVMGLTQSTHNLDALEAKASELGLQTLIRGFFPKVRLLAQLPRESWKRVDSVGEYPDAHGFSDDHKPVPSPFSSVTIDGKTHTFNGVGKIGPDEVDKVKALLGDGAAKKPAGLTAKDFEIRSYRNRNEAFINRAGDAERRPLKTFTGTDKKQVVADARAWLNSNVAELEAAWEKVKARDNVSKADTRRGENRARVGTDRRSGKDVTPAMFEDALGFRGVQFGNWVGQGKGSKDRQGLLNESYDALMDLADLLGIPSKAISLNGSLGLSLGARGNGAHSAHFEPSNLVINLTKTRGAGTLAHEWFHALDNYFSRLRGGEVPFNGDQAAYRRDNYITYKPEPAWVLNTTPRTGTAGGSFGPRVSLRTGFTSAALRRMLTDSGNWDASKTLEQNAEAAGWQRDPNHKEGVRPEVEKAFAGLVQALNDSPMSARAASMDSSKTGDGYWHRIIERGARSFENYVISKLALQGQANDFLANVRDWKQWAALGKNEQRYPYLRPEEEAPVVAAFDGLFDTLETRTGDDGRVALFSRDADETTEADTSPFYSAALRAVEQAKGAPKKADAAGWKGWLDGAVRRGDMKQSEREWLGIDQWLAEQKAPVTREQLAQFVRDNQVQVKEVTLGDGDDADVEAWWNDEGGANEETPFSDLSASEQQDARERYADEVGRHQEGATKFGSYQLPGGDNYKELLLTLPATNDGLPRRHRVEQRGEGNWAVVLPNGPTIDRFPTRAAAIDSQRNNPDTANFRSSHFDHPNILAHVRFNERTDADGKKMLFLEEVQSDWHQTARKRGYGEKWGVVWGGRQTAANVGVYDTEAEAEAAAKVLNDENPYDEYGYDVKKGADGVPDAPFKKTGEWSMLAFKRMVRYAAENGFDRIGWTTGEQQAARYDLSKQVDGIQVMASSKPDYVHVLVKRKNGDGDFERVSGDAAPIEKSKLADTIGKDLADKAIAKLDAGATEAEFHGVDLKIGGEGMKAFYDKMLPAEVNKWGKAFGAKVEQSNIPTPGVDAYTVEMHPISRDEWLVHDGSDNVVARFRTKAEAKAEADRLGALARAGTSRAKIHSIDITPQMRDAALGGQPLFRRGSGADDLSPSATTEQLAHTAKVKSITDGLTKDWKGDDVPRVVVVATPEQLPAIAKRAANGLPSDAYKNANGMYDGHTVWVVASRHPDSEAGRAKLTRTLTHEVIGHYGTERIVTRELGDDAWTKIEDATDRLRQNPELASAGVRSVLDRLAKDYAGIDRKTYAQEFLAVSAEKGVHTGLLDRAIAAIRRFIRKLFPDLRLSEHELRNLLVHSKEYIERGETQQQMVQSRAALAFSSDGAAAPDTPAFREFFGDSKVVDAEGNPLPVYHGTAEEFDTFDPQRSGSATAHMTANLGTFFAEDRAKAQHYAENASQGVPAEERVVDAYLSIQKPYEMSLKQFMGIDSQEESQTLREKLISEGYDGIHLKDVGQWVAFHPNQIKSASENRGTFDSNSGNIYFSRDDADPDNPKPKPRPFGDASASIEAIHDTLPKLDTSNLQAVKDWIAGKARDLEPLALGGIQLRHVLELASEDPTLKNPATRYADLYQRMDGDRNRMTTEGAAKVDALQKWAKKPGAAGWLGKIRPEAAQLFKFMHAVTQLAIDPTNAYEKLLMRDAHNEYKPWTKDLIKHRIQVLRETALTRSGDDKTRLFDEIKDLQRLPQRERVRQERYPKLVAQWNALSPEAKHHFEVMRDYYQEQSAALEEATIQQINGLEIPDHSKRAALQMVRNNFQQAKVDGVYFPLSRFGDYWMSVRMKDGEYVFAKYENAQKFAEAEKRFLASGAEIEARGRQDNNYRAKDAPSGTFIGDLMGVLKNAPDKMKDEIYQMYLKTLPALSLRKHGIHRSNVAGYSDDVPRAFAGSVFHGAHQISKARYGWQLQSTLEQMRERMEARRTVINASQAAHGDALLSELSRRHDWIMNPSNSQLANKLTSIGFSWFLAASPASALVNLIQVPQIVLPVLGARHGWGKASRMLSAAMRDAISTGGNIGRKLSGEDLLAFKALQEQGTFQRSATHALAGVSEGDQLRSSPAYTKVMNAVSWMFHTSEVINREGTGIAAFRLARSEGSAVRNAIRQHGLADGTPAQWQAWLDSAEKSGTITPAGRSMSGVDEWLKAQPAFTYETDEAGNRKRNERGELITRPPERLTRSQLAEKAKNAGFDSAVKYADEITNGTHGDYSNANRARYMQGNVAKVALQFKNYSLAMSWLWGRNFYKAFKGESPEVRAVARRTLTGMLGMTGLFAGVIGMPIFNLLRYGAQAVHAVGGDDDEPWDFVTEFRSWLAEHLGQEAADIIAGGLASQAGANVASRVSMSDLWFRDADRQLEGVDAYHNMLEAFAGPLGGLVKNMYVGSQQFNEGHTWRGIETMLPSAAKNAMKAMRYESQGVNNLRGDPIVPDVSLPQALIQAIGFQPTKVADQQRINSALMNYQTFVQDRRQALMNAFAMANQAGDQEGTQDTIERIQKFNAKYPEIAITVKTLRTSMRTRAQRSAQAENGIFLQKKLASRIRQEVGASAGE